VQNGQDPRSGVGSMSFDLCHTAHSDSCILQLTMLVKYARLIDQSGTLIS
jgi:hypothetical protein